MMLFAFYFQKIFNFYISSKIVCFLADNSGVAYTQSRYLEHRNALLCIRKENIQTGFPSILITGTTLGGQGKPYPY